jgi:hypothetical protein
MTDVLSAGGALHERETTAPVVRVRERLVPAVLAREKVHAILDLLGIAELKEDHLAAVAVHFSSFIAKR